MKQVHNTTNGLCPSCTLSACMKDCKACQEWYKRIFRAEYNARIKAGQDNTVSTVKEN